VRRLLRLDLCLCWRGGDQLLAAIQQRPDSDASISQLNLRQGKETEETAPWDGLAQHQKK
jgi:hypothetical protein